MSTKRNLREDGLTHCGSMRSGTCVEGDDNPVGHLCPDWTPAVDLPGGMDPVAQKYDGQTPVGVDPDGGTGEPGMAKGVFREAIAGTAPFRRRVPPETPARAGHQTLPPGELGEHAGKQRRSAPRRLQA